MRIFIGTIEISGNYSALAEGFRQLGYPVSLVFSSPHPFDYGHASVIPSEQFFYAMRNRISGWGGGGLPRFLSFFAWFFLRVAKAFIGRGFRLVWAFNVIRHHDVFIFGYGSSLLPGNCDLPLLGFMRKKIVISNIEHGSEALPPVADGAWRAHEDSVLSAKELRALTVRTRRTVRRHEKYADVFVGNPLSSTYFATRKMVNSYFLGRPLDFSKPLNREPLPSSPMKRELVLVHAPSHAPGKGSKEIEHVVETLQREGVDFIFRKIEGVSNSKVLEVLGTCDLVIDQIYSDRYWSKIAAEAAILGKPTLISGYAFATLEKIIPPEKRPPVFWCHPDDFERKLREILSDREGLLTMGHKAQEYARQNYEAKQVAGRYTRLFSPQTIPKSWLFDPAEVSYLAGCGQSLTKTAENYRTLVSRYGIESLGLKHKRHLRIQAIKEFGV